MAKEKGYVCGYTFCKHMGERVPPDVAVKDGTRYYHPDCLKEKEEKKQIIDLYYKYYHSNEDMRLVTKHINTLISSGNDSNYILFCMCQCIREKVPFKSIYTLGWEVKNKSVWRQKYDRIKAQQAVKDFTFDDVEVVDAQIDESQVCRKSCKRSSWENTIFGG